MDKMKKYLIIKESLREFIVLSKCGQNLGSLFFIDISP